MYVLPPGLSRPRPGVEMVPVTRPDDPLQIAPGIQLPPGSVRLSFARSSGPGGQNVNKVNTKAICRIDRAALANVLSPAAIQRLERLAGHLMSASGLAIASDRFRQQEANRRQCIDRLRELILRARRIPRRRRPTRPTASSVQRRLQTKEQRSCIKGLRRRVRLDDA